MNGTRAISKVNHLGVETYHNIASKPIPSKSTPANSSPARKMPAKRLLSPPPSSPPKETFTPSPSLPLPHFLTLTRPQISTQFRLLAAHEQSLATAAGAYLQPHPTILTRDRYTDIRPWAHNRISLSGAEHPEDYINASPVALGRKERFIATQGPKSEDAGTKAFWRMSWQEGVRVVVMLTRCVEQGREKCGVYHPLNVGEEGRLVVEGWGSVECVGTERVGGSEVRELKVTKLKEGDEEEESRTVWHFLFLGWPDMDVPKTREDQRALLELIGLTRDKMGEAEEGKETPPKIVHCSAGVGRTGTFIALDHLLQDFEEGKWDTLAKGEAENKELDPIFETVKKLRDQRMGLVYRVGQYAFIYQILKEKWEEKNGPKTPGERADGEAVLESPAKRRRFSQVDEDEEDFEDDDEDWPSMYAGHLGKKV